MLMYIQMFYIYSYLICLIVHIFVFCGKNDEDRFCNFQKSKCKYLEKNTQAMKAETLNFYKSNIYYYLQPVMVMNGGLQIGWYCERLWKTFKNQMNALF